MPQFSKQLALVVAVIVLTVLAIIGLSLSKPTVERAPVEVQPPLVDIIPMQPESLSIPIETRGLVSPGVEIPLTAEAGGKVVWIASEFANGGFFRKGDKLVQLDAKQYDLDITRAKASVATAKQGLARAKAERAARRGVSGLNSNSAFGSGQLQVDEAQARLDAAKAELEAARIQKSRTLIEAPFDGRVRQKMVDVGQYTRPGVQIATIYSVDVAEIRLPISDDQIGLLDIPYRFDAQQGAEKGARAVFKTTYADKSFEWQGRVVRAEGGVDARNRLLYVVAEVDNPYEQDPSQPTRPPLTAGTFVEAKVDGNEYQGIFSVPREALRADRQLWLVDRQNRLTARRVDLLHKGRENVYVSEGLNAGERVVVTRLDVAVEGMQVRARDVSTGGEIEPVALSLKESAQDRSESASVQPQPTLTETDDLVDVADASSVLPLPKPASAKTVMMKEAKRPRILPELD